MSSTATLFDRQYSYNNANQISQIAEPTNTRNFGYDNLDRLTSMTNGVSNESYTFDAVGNRTASHLSNTYNYQPFNKMTATQTAMMLYNNNGNLQRKSEGKDLWRYNFDHENRLTFAKNRRERVNYVYDALGRRVRTSNFLKGSTKYTYDGLDVIQDNDSNTGITKYQNGLGIDDKLKLKNGSNSSYFLADHLGSTNGLTNSSGSLTSSASYDSFGNPTGNLATRYQFTGREKDDVTGLYYYRARWYDSKLGRFISEDPIGFAGDDVNLYGYVGNNPLNLFDPFGLAANPKYKQKCESWKKTIENIEQDIRKRTGEMAENKLGLPWRAAGDSKNPALSRWGHQKIINELKARKAELEGYVSAYCNDDDNNPPEPESCPIKVGIPSIQPTMEELRLQIESAQQMEQFWTKVLVGSAVGGAVYLAPTLIPAAVPQIPRLVQQSPQFAY
jgi:RHS repeat-associated protein